MQPELFPTSWRIADDRSLPEIAKGSPIQVLFDAMAREYRPYTSAATYPTPHRPTMPIAKDAGYFEIPSYGNRENSNSNLYMGEQASPLLRLLRGTY